MIKTVPAVVLAIIFGVGVARLFFIHPTFSDENIYFLMGKHVAEGEIPYKEFGLAHPPLQIYMLAFLFTVFGASILAGKLLTLISTSASAYLIFLIAKELYREKAALFSVVLFFITPAFIAFSMVGDGLWESMAFVLLSLYMLLKNRLWLSAISFVTAIFIRYIAAVYFPFLLLYLAINNKRIMPYFLRFSISMLIPLVVLLLFFGYEFIEQSISFQIYSRFSLPKQVYQYWGIGFFTMFLSIIAAVVAYNKKDKQLLLFSVYPILADILIFATFQTIFYHYFIISIPLITIAVAKACFVSKNRIIYLFISVIIILAIFNNFNTIDFYLNPARSKQFYTIEDFIRNSTSEGDTIFGEPVITSYASFASGRRIAHNYIGLFYELVDAQQQHEIIKNLEQEKPRFFIEMDDYYTSNPQFAEYLANYNIAEQISDVQIYERK